ASSFLAPSRATACASKKDRGDDELILVDQTVLSELRHDGAASENHDVFAGLLLQGLDLARVELVEKAGIPPRDILPRFGNDQFGRLVDPVRHRANVL